MLRPRDEDRTSSSQRRLRLERLDALPPGFRDLAADALGDGSRILQVLEEDWEAGLLRFNGPGEALFGAFSREELVGLGGLSHDPYLRESAVMRVRRVYVLRAARRGGVGRALMEAVGAAGQAAGAQRLRVRAPISAFAFYERCGFLRAVGEPAATHVLHLKPLSRA